MSLRERKRVQTVAAIRDAAARLFAERGFEATRTRDIAEAAGIATGTLFNYAPTKEDVVLLIWKERASRAVEAGFQAASAVRDPVDAIAALFGPIYALYAEDLDLGRVFLHHVIYRHGDDEELRAINDGFVARIGVMLLPHAGAGAMAGGANVFAAYYLCLTAMLARRSSASEAQVLFRELVRAQARGWTG